MSGPGPYALFTSDTPRWSPRSAQRGHVLAAPWAGKIASVHSSQGSASEQPATDPASAGVRTDCWGGIGGQPERGRSRFGAVVRRFQLPNVLTTIRILLIPVFLVLILGSGTDLSQPGVEAGRWWALVAFVVLMVTDQLDGFLARKYVLITNFGKLADPIADKALMISALVSLNILGLLWWWVTAVIVVRELGITAWRMVLARNSRVVPASQGGKIKTVLQSVAVGLYIAPLPGWLGWTAHVVMAVAVAVTVVTGVQYVVDAQRDNATGGK